MPNDRNEVSYYPEIQRYIEEQLCQGRYDGQGR